MITATDRPVLFISDLHLAAERPALVDLALRFFNGPARSAQSLYILGDLFEYWLGDSAIDDVALSVFDALAALAGTGVAVAFMHGNRDYMVGARAARAGRFTLLNDPTIIDLFGRKAVLLHGDTLCTDDRAYQRYRRFVRARTSIAITNALPRFLIQRMAQSLRAKSESSKQVKSALLMDVNAAAVEAVFTDAAVDLMIHGHTHRPAHHRTTVANRPCDRYVLADWYERGSYLEASRDRILIHDWR